MSKRVHRNTISSLRRLATRAALTVAASAAAASAFSQGFGTWTRVTNNAPESTEMALLLTDGTVMVHSYSTYSHWNRLTPDSHMNYVNGAWNAIPIHSMAFGRLYGLGSVLKDGRVINGGGEYLQGTSDHNSAEVFTDSSTGGSWAPAPDSLYSALGDTAFTVLPDGKELCSNWTDNRTDIYDPVTNKWSAAGVMSDFTGDEEGFELLPDGTIFDAFRVAQRYIPAQNKWIPSATIPVNLVDSAFEIGPALLLHNATVLCIGANGKTAIFTPPTTLNGLGSFAIGPNLPNGEGEAGDTPACVMVDGNVLGCGAASLFGTAGFWVYDHVANTITSIPGPPGQTYPQDYTLRMLALPSGQVLLTGTGSTVWVYTPAGAPHKSWLPTITTVANTGNGTYLLTGTQLNGLTTGGQYGDESSPQTNYAIVVLLDQSGNYHRCRTHDHSTMQIATGTTPVSTTFDVPTGLAHGDYTLYVITNGIRSLGRRFSY